MFIHVYTYITGNIVICIENYNVVPIRNQQRLYRLYLYRTLMYTDVKITMLCLNTISVSRSTCQKNNYYIIC